MVHNVPLNECINHLSLCLCLCLFYSILFYLCLPQNTTNHLIPPENAISTIKTLSAITMAYSDICSPILNIGADDVILSASPRKSTKTKTQTKKQLINRLPLCEDTALYSVHPDEKKQLALRTSAALSDRSSEINL